MKNKHIFQKIYPCHAQRFHELAVLTNKNNMNSFKAKCNEQPFIKVFNILKRVTYPSLTQG